MDIKKDKVMDLMITYCNGNYNEFARRLKCNPGHLHRTLNKPNKKAGPKLLGSIMAFCEANGLNYKDYIFLNEPLTACNSDAREGG